MIELVLVPAVIAVVGLIVHREYSDWAPRLGHWMVLNAARFHPNRDRMRDEWLAELEAVRRDPSEAQGLTFAASIFVRYVLSAPIRVLDPTDVGILLPWAILLSRTSLHLLPIQVAVVTSIGVLWDRRRLRKLPPGEILVKRGVVEPAKSRAAFIRYLVIRSLFVGYFFWFAARYGSTTTYMVVFGWATWFGLLTFSPNVGQVVNEWARRRIQLIDPRGHESEGRLDR